MKRPGNDRPDRPPSRVPRRRQDRTRSSDRRSRRRLALPIAAATFALLAAPVSPTRRR